jgi:hypothetical protein
VAGPGSRPTALKAVRSARPVIIPGRAMGRSSSSDTAFFLEAVTLSLKIAALSTAIALVLGTLAAGALWRSTAPCRLAEPAQRQPLRRKAEGSIFGIKSIDGDDLYLAFVKRLGAFDAL